MNPEHNETTTKIPIAIPTLDGEEISEIIEIEVPCTINIETGDKYITGDALSEIDRIKARYMGLLQPEEIKDIRTSLGLTQKEMCELLQIGAKSYSRWETGRERPSRSMNILLKALQDGKIDIKYLQSLQVRSVNAEQELLRVGEEPENDQKYMSGKK